MSCDIFVVMSCKDTKKSVQFQVSIFYNSWVFVARFSTGWPRDERTGTRYRLYSNRCHLFKGDKCDNRRNFIPIKALEGYSGKVFQGFSSLSPSKKWDSDEERLFLIPVIIYKPESIEIT